MYYEHYINPHELQCAGVAADFRHSHACMLPILTNKAIKLEPDAFV